MQKEKKNYRFSSRWKFSNNKINLIWNYALLVEAQIGVKHSKHLKAVGSEDNIWITSSVPLSISFEKGEGLLFNEPGINSRRARYNVTCALKPRTWITRTSGSSWG